MFLKVAQKAFSEMGNRAWKKPLAWPSTENLSSPGPSLIPHRTLSARQGMCGTLTRQVTYDREGKCQL